jgi:hypothetical protein
MAADIFGYNRTIKSNDQIVSSEFLTLTLGKKVSLLQSCNCTYQRDIQPVFVVGDSTVYFVHGHASGTLEASRLVGKDGILSSFKGVDCGKITPMSVNLGGEGSCSVSGGGSVNFQGAMLRSVGFQTNAGQLQIAESASVIFGALSL